MVAEAVTCIVLVLAVVAEMLHARRCRRIAHLAFGPKQKPMPWVGVGTFLRVAAVAAVCWGMISLMYEIPKVHRAEILPDGKYRHILMVLDVSPSMRLQDAGPTKELSRMQRASEVMESFFKRVPIEQYRISVIAVYTGAKPVVIDTTDIEVVRNVLNDLPMHHAFTPGKTDVFAGLEEAARTAKPWEPKSTTVVLVSDGDTVPATGMPKMPASVSNVLVVGVGDPVTGMFIDGGQSRQDASTLRQIALRLRGTYHNGNEHHLSTDLLRQLTQTNSRSKFEELTRREWALIACACGAMILAILPILLHYAGTVWRPGVTVVRQKIENIQQKQAEVSTGVSRTV